MDDLFGHFEGRVVCADDGLIGPGRGKPHPDIFLVTAQTCFGKDVGEGEESEGKFSDKQRVERAKGLVFEDAIPGVQAAKRAGMKGAQLLPRTCWVSADEGFRFSGLGTRREFDRSR